MYKIRTIREFQTENFHVIVDAIDESDLDLSWDESHETAQKIDTGEYVAFCARARVFFRGLEVASDYLGNCVYKTIEEFEDHKECAEQNRNRIKREGHFQIYRKKRPYEHCLSASDKLRKRGFATRERAEAWAKANTSEAYEIFPSGKCGSYFADMVSEVCREARKTVSRMKSIHIREVSE